VLSAASPEPDGTAKASAASTLLRAARLISLSFLKTGTVMQAPYSTAMAMKTAVATNAVTKKRLSVLDLAAYGTSKGTAGSSQT
jgi:hypothetical protein